MDFSHVSLHPPHYKTVSSIPSCVLSKHEVFVILEYFIFVISGTTEESDLRESFQKIKQICSVIEETFKESKYKKNNN